MAVNQNTLSDAKLYTDAVARAHTDAADPHPQYAQITDALGASTGGSIILAKAGDPTPAVQRGSVYINPTGLFIANQLGTAWVQLGLGPVPADTTPPTSPSALHTTTIGTTSFTAAWNASADTESGVARYEVALGAGAAFLSNGTALTKSYTGLTAGTAYTVRVRSVDNAGNVSNEVSMQVVTTSATDTTPPGSPPNLRTTGVTNASVNLAWDAATDLGGGTIGRYEVAQDTGGYVSNGTALTRNMTGLTAGTNHTFKVRAVDDAGNIGPAAQISVTTTGGAVVVNTLMGISNYSSTISGYSTWDAWKVSRTSAAIGAVGKGGKIIGVTDDPNISRTGGQASATTLDNFLLGFYGRTGTPSSNATVQVHFASGNEVDAESITNFTAFANTYELMETVVAKYPMASLWLDATVGHLDTTTDTFLNAQATSGRRVYQMLDGLAGSYYPPARKNYPNMLDSSFTDPNVMVDSYIATMLRFGITKASVWEVGIPRAITDPIGWPSPGTKYNAPQKRPDYIENFVHVWLRKCIANGIEPVICCYWDDQTTTTGGVQGDPSNTNPDNRFVTDTTVVGAAVSPTTATKFRNAVATFTG